MWLLFIYAGNSPVSILGFSKGRHHLKIVPLGCGRRYTALPFTFIIWLKTNWYKKKSFLLKIVSIVTNKLLIVLYIFVSVVLCGHFIECDCHQILMTCFYIFKLLYIQLCTHFRVWLPSDFDDIVSIHSNCYICNYVPTCFETLLEELCKAHLYRPAHLPKYWVVDDTVTYHVAISIMYSIIDIFGYTEVAIYDAVGDLLF